MDTPSHVREIGSVRPRLRSSLRFIFQDFGGERCCVIEDPLTSKFHRVGLAEYRFLRQLDGAATFSEAFARASLESGAEALTEREAIGVLSWLVENRLADIGGSIPEEALHASRGRKLSARMKNVMNILFIKLPLGRPDEFLARVYPVFKYACGWMFFAVWLLLGFAALGQVAVNRDRFLAGTEGVLAPHNWLWLLVVWAGLKVWHEFWHGIVCKHHGGHIREAGVQLVLMTPLGYVDATSSLAFPSKWARMHVAAAGMYGELFLASIAALVWAQTDPGLINTLAMNVMVMASVVTLLFNLNPLMRFDGYFLFVDLLEKPNLATRSSQLVGSLGRRWLLGVPSAPVAWGEADTWLRLVYGIASLVWRVLIVLTLIAAAALLFKGGGLLFALTGLLFWIVPMVSSFVKSLGGKRGQAGGPGVWAAAWRCGLFAAVLLAIGLVPFRLNITTPGLVRHEGEAILRAEGPGFVQTVHTRDGATAEAGALLVTLHNPELEMRLDALAVDHRRQDFKRRLALVQRTTAEYEAEVALLDALRKQYLQQLDYVQTLDVQAPRAGRVQAPYLEKMQGRFVRTGDELLRVVDPAAVEVVIPIAQDDIEAFRRQLGGEVEVYFPGRNTVWSGHLHRISGRADTALENPALTTLAGGPLAVKPRTAGGGEKNGPAHELVQPYFWGDIRLPQEIAAQLRAGERVRVKFLGKQSRSLAERARGRFIRFIDHVFASTATA
jgi:putative peptide zinc metalloprotease protein